MPSSKTFKFTKTRLIELPPAKGKSRYRVFDTEVRGFNLLVTKTGYKSFYLNRVINGKTERIFIGPFPILSVEQGRMRAEVLAGEIALGEDPQEARRQKNKELTLGQLMEEYLEQHAKKKNKSWKYDEQQFSRNASQWADRKISTITRKQINSLHTRLKEERGLYSANRLLTLLRTLYNMASKWDLFDGRNPTHGIDKYKEPERQRYITEEEMPIFLKALDAEPDPDFRDYVLLSLFTGLRQCNVLGMMWSQISFMSKTYIIPCAKNGDPHVAQLSDRSLEILKRRHRDRLDGVDCVFPSIKNPNKPRHRFAYEWKNFLERAGIMNLRMHDLRHTHATWMANSGADLALIQKALGHKQPRMTLRYAHHCKSVVKGAQVIAIDWMMAQREETLEGDQAVG